MVRMVSLQNRERVAMVRENSSGRWPEWFVNPQQRWNFPHKSACVLGDTWLSRSMLLSTWSLFLSSKELRITGFIFPTLVLFRNTL
jgi:hypothetical protein